MVRLTSAALLFLALIVFLQWRSGTYSAGFAGPDEPDHFVTGLMVHDYLTHWTPTPPMRFAEDFYFHYPAVGVGHWPPLFYFLEGIWMILAGEHRSSVLVLMALFTLMLALTTYWFIRPEYGDTIGIAAGILLICVPLVQQYSAQVMIDIPVALFSLWGALAFGFYLDTERWQYSAWFGVFAACAILTKGTGGAVLLVVLALVPLGRLSWLKRGSFWIAPAIVAAFCGGWYVFTLSMVQNGLTEKAGWEFLLKALPWNGLQIARMLGIGLAPLIALGVAVKCIRSQPARGRWVALGTLVLGVWLFQSSVPASLAERYLLTTAAPLVLFLFAGVAWLSNRIRLSQVSLTHRCLILILLVFVLFGTTKFSIPRFASSLFPQVAADLLARPDLRHAVFLVSSQRDGEGRFIAEMAEREPRPGHILLRGSKMLADGDWSGKENRLVYSSSEQALKFLDSVPVAFLVLHGVEGDRFFHGPNHPDYPQIVEVLNRNPSVWTPVGNYSTQKDARGVTEIVRIYEYRFAQGRPVGKIRISMERMLGHSIER